MQTPVFLILKPGGQIWERYPINKAVITIGRSPDNDLVLDHPATSRQHARVRVDAESVWVMDLGSPNGVMINNTLIQPGHWTRLGHESVIEIGQVLLRLEMPLQPAKSQPGQTQTRPESARYGTARPTTPQTQKRNWIPLTITLGVIALCGCLIISLAGGAWYFYPQLAQLIPGIPADPFATQGPAVSGGSNIPEPSPQPSPTPTQIPIAPPITVEVLQIPAGGGTVEDSRGARLDVPAGTLPDDQQAALESASLSPGMEADLSQAYQIDSLAYSVSASQDGAAGGLLSLPAPSSESRLMVLVDDRYPGILEVTPQNGILAINPFVGAPTNPDGYPTLAQSATPNRYLVVTPKTSSRVQTQKVSFPISNTQPQAGDPDGKSCITEFWLVSHCWRNQAGSVYVFWENNVPAELKDVEYLRIIDMIASVSEIMTTYNQTHQYSNAAISPSNPVYIIIDPAESEPTYSQKTGNIYLNWGAVATITSPENRCTLAHELMHFTQDTAYNMSAAAVSNPKSWWIEMTAENGAFLIDPVCIDRNLQTYGRALTNDNLLPLQAASLMWANKEGARYLQALQFYVALCDGGANCALSKAQMVNAINSGSYPFDDASVLSRYQKAADDMGLYLLGNAPANANTGAHIIPATKSGGAFAEYIWLKALPDYRMDISNNGAQISSSSSTQAAVKASIAQGSEYPLWVSNGKGVPDNPRAGYTSLPVMVKIDAGTKLWYMLDEQGPVFHDGSKELTLGPVSDKLGVGLVRLVAVAPDTATTLNAAVKPVDLDGDWAATLNEGVSNPIYCPSSESDNSGGKVDPTELNQLEFLTIFSGYGAYEPDPAVSDGSHLIWSGTFPEGATGESEITIKPDAIEVKFHLVIPKPDATSFASRLLGASQRNWLAQAAADKPYRPWQNSAGLLAFGGLAALGGVVVKYKPGIRRIINNVLILFVLVGAAGWLSGCIGISLWGTFDGTYTFKKLAYVDPDKAAAEAASADSSESQPAIKWKLTDGSLDATYDLYFEVTTADLDGKETVEVTECKVGVTAKAEGIVGPADMAPALGSDD